MSLGLIGLSATAVAQGVSTTYGGGVGAGWSLAEGAFGQRVHNGYDLTGEFLVLAPGAPAAIRFDGMYDHFTASPALINEFPTAQSGTASIIGGMFDIVAGTPAGSGFHPYGLFGFGGYVRDVSVDRKAGTAVTFNDRYWGYKSYAVPANATNVSASEVRFGTSYGGGISVGFPAISLFAEIRYHIIFTSVAHTDVLPITLGIRF